MWTEQWPWRVQCRACSWSNLWRNRPWWSDVWTALPVPVQVACCHNTTDATYTMYTIVLIDNTSPLPTLIQRSTGRYPKPQWPNLSLPKFTSAINYLKKVHKSFIMFTFFTVMLDPPARLFTVLNQVKHVATKFHGRQLPLQIVFLPQQIYLTNFVDLYILLVPLAALFCIVTFKTPPVIAICNG